MRVAGGESTMGGSLTRQRALNVVKMGEDVRSRSARGPWSDGPQVGLQSVERRQAAVILENKPQRKSCCQHLS